MANARDEEDLFSSDFGSDFDYDDTTTLPLCANFDLAGVFDVSDGNGDSSRSSSPASDGRSDDGSNNNMDVDDYGSESDTHTESEEYTHTPAHLQFVFEELDIETLPEYDWKHEEKVEVIPPFQPDKPYGPTRAMPPNSKPMDYFSLFYDDAMLQKVCMCVYKLL